MTDMTRSMWGIEKDPLIRSTIVAIASLDRSPVRARLTERIDRATADIAACLSGVLQPTLSVDAPEGGLRQDLRPN